jgi:hypothetical protein
LQLILSGIDLKSVKRRKRYQISSKCFWYTSMYILYFCSDVTRSNRTNPHWQPASPRK